MYQKINKLPILGAVIFAVLSAPAHAKVEDLFKSTCASCHGETLTGGMAGSLVDKTWLSSGTDQALTDAINKGIASAGMPAFGSVLTDEEVRTLVVYIREAGAKVAQQQTPESEFGKAFKTKYHSVSTQEVLSTDGIVWALDFLPDNS